MEHQTLIFGQQDLKAPATAPPKLFSLTQSLKQQENRVILDKSSPFMPARGNGHAGAQPIFPGLRRLQNTIQTTPSANRQQKPFFSLLNATLNSAKLVPVQESAEIFKQEPPSSDKAFSLSPPPSEQMHISSTTDIGLGTSTNLPRPHQMLPPPIPPQGPDSRPPSPAPRPRPRSRSRSRSSSSMALGRGDEEGDGGDDTSCHGMDVDVDAVAINALRGVRVANAELGEERRRSKSLLAQLNALTITHESLKREHSSASEELRSVLEELTKRKENASVLREERDKAILQREQAKEKIEVLRRGMSELGESYAALKTTFGELKESCENEKKSREDAQNVKLWARESLKKLEPLLEDDTYLAKEARGLVTSLKEELADSRRVIDLLRDKLHHFSSILADAQNQIRELEDARRESTEQVKSFLERVEKGAEERVEIAKRRMEEMEGELNVLKECRNAKLSQDIRLEHLTKTFSELQEAHITTTAALDALRSERIELGGVNDGLIRSLAEAEEKRRSETAAHEKELDAVKKVAKDAEESQRQTDLRMVALQERFDAQTMTLRLTKEQYGDIQERLQMSEETLSKTRETLDAIRENARAEVLRISHEALGRTEELRQSDARLAEFKEQCAVLQEDKKKLEEALSDSRKIQETQRIALEKANSRYIELEAKMHGALKEKADELSKAEVKLASSKEQLEAREMMFTRSLQEKRDEIEALKEKLHNAEVTVLGLKAQEALLKQSLKEKIDEAEAAKKEGKTKEAELHNAEVKVAALQEQLKAQELVLKQTQGRYGDLQKASATLAADLTSAQNALEEARKEVLQRAQDSTKLVKLFECIEADRVKAREENARRAKEEEEHVRVENERVTELILVVERLEDEKRALLERTGRLRERYNRNELNDDEKDFAEWLMSLARSLHEEEEVVKDNELRRKDNLVNQLHVKIRELESSLAHLIKEKEVLSGGAGKSMIDVDAFMTSSPSPCPTEASLPCGRTVPVDVNPSAKHIPPLTKPLDLASAHVKQATALAITPKTLAPKKPTGLSFSSLNESDSEEDIPLSEASASAKSVLGKRDRVSSPSQTRAPVQQPIQDLDLKTHTGSHRLRNGAASRTTNSSSVQASMTVQKKAVDSSTKPRKKRK